MKAVNYKQVLKFRGYKAREIGRDCCVYEKEHIYNKIVCYVKKDSHCKGQEMTFQIYTGRKQPKDMVEFKAAEFDRSYLVMEANKIHEAFEQLKVLKAPKYIYCF